MRTSTWIAELIEEHWPDVVANLGDTYDCHASVDTPALCTGIRAMETISQACKGVAARFLMLPGNHDAYSHDYSSLEVFKNLGIDIVWEPAVFDGLIGALPFCKNSGVVTKWIKDLEKEAKVVLAHVDVEHARYFSGVDSHIGVCADDFRGPIYCGHYHHPHSLGAFEFIGSALHHNFTDHIIEGCPRGVVLVTFGKNGVKETERIANPHTTIYHKLDWDKPKEARLARRLYRKAGDRMHIRIKCALREVAKVKADAKEVFAKALSISVVGVNKDASEVKREVEVRVDTAPEEVVKAYVKNKGVPKGLKKDKLLESGKQLLSEV